MFALGVILIVAAVGSGAFMAWAASTSTIEESVTVAGVTISLQPMHYLIAGATAMVILALGWRAFVAGTKRKAARRRELKALRAQEAARPAPAPAAAPATGPHSDSHPTDGA